MCTSQASGGSVRVKSSDGAIRTWQSAKSTVQPACCAQAIACLRIASSVIGGTCAGCHTLHLLSCLSAILLHQASVATCGGAETLGPPLAGAGWSRLEPIGAGWSRLVGIALCMVDYPGYAIWPMVWVAQWRYTGALGRTSLLLDTDWIPFASSRFIPLHRTLAKSHHGAV